MITTAEMAAKYGDNFDCAPHGTHPTIGKCECDECCQWGEDWDDWEKTYYTVTPSREELWEQIKLIDAVIYAVATKLGITREQFAEIVQVSKEIVRK